MRRLLNHILLPSAGWKQRELNSQLYTLGTRRCRDVESTSVTLLQLRKNVVCPVTLIQRRNWKFHLVDDGVAAGSYPREPELKMWRQRKTN